MIKKGVCKHYNGVYGAGMKQGTCEKGVIYRSLVGTPCFKKHDTDTVCELYSEPTQKDFERQKEKEKLWERNFDKLMIALYFIKSEHSCGDSGKMKCPVCDKTLTWLISGYNGHITAQCETKGCIFVID